MTNTDAVRIVVRRGRRQGVFLATIIGGEDACQKPYRFEWRQGNKHIRLGRRIKSDSNYRKIISLIWELRGNPEKKEVEWNRYTFSAGHIARENVYKKMGISGAGD